jgi:hypothetical protein
MSKQILMTLDIMVGWWQQGFQDFTVIQHRRHHPFSSQITAKHTMEEEYILISPSSWTTTVKFISTLSQRAPASKTLLLSLRSSNKQRQFLRLT